MNHMPTSISTVSALIMLISCVRQLVNDESQSSSSAEARPGDRTHSIPASTATRLIPDPRNPMDDVNLNMVSLAANDLPDQEFPFTYQLRSSGRDISFPETESIRLSDGQLMGCAS